MNSVTNIAAYKFTPLSGLKEVRSRLQNLCRELGLKGTILLSSEGINLFVAGSRIAVDSLLAELRRLPGLELLEGKISESSDQPFNRMLVRIKKEIIAFGVPGIDPSRKTSPKISARELKQWLDEGRPVTLLDTRNEYEVKLGTFQNAIAAGIDHFREFPKAVSKLPQTLKEHPIVMFCTGGIRCEKAGPYMEREGFNNVFQLEGGILKYFEECGSAHYQGECFVFDQRVGVDPALNETQSTQCFNCLTPLTAEEEKSERYQPPKSCPYCYKTTEQEMAEKIARRHEAIARETTPLPGSVGYDNFRPITVPLECDGHFLLEFLEVVLPHIPKKEWGEVIGRSCLLDSKKSPVNCDRVVRAGERYLHKLGHVTEPEVNGAIEILHEDEAILVINKPAPLPMHPSGRYNRNTLQYILQQVYYPQKPRPAHRLDANTTGLVIITRTRHFASKLQPQFAKGQVEKLYCVRVQGTTPDKFICDAAISADPGEVGTREVDYENGLNARTVFRVIQRCRDGTTVLEARPLTGRTNQIRVHLWQMGWPVCGDPVYLLGQKLGKKQTLDLGEQPLQLHAGKISFVHPLTNQRVEYTAPLPSWVSDIS